MKHLDTYNIKYDTGDILLLKDYSKKQSIVKVIKDGSFKELVYVKTLFLDKNESFYVNKKSIIRKVSENELNEIKIKIDSKKYNL